MVVLPVKCYDGMQAAAFSLDKLDESTSVSQDCGKLALSRLSTRCCRMALEMYMIIYCNTIPIKVELSFHLRCCVLALLSFALTEYRIPCAALFRFHAVKGQARPGESGLLGTHSLLLQLTTEQQTTISASEQLPLCFSLAEVRSAKDAHSAAGL